MGQAVLNKNSQDNEANDNNVDDKLKTEEMTKSKENFYN